MRRLFRPVGLVAAAFCAVAPLTSVAPTSAASPAWSIVATPNVNPPSGSLAAVSCSSATACTAVGHSGASDTPKTLAERWNGTTWVIQATPNPPGALSSELSGVQCPTATTCIAVGASGSGALAEQWNGRTWKLQKITGDTLSAVSCVTARFCAAVGGGGGVELWNGSLWTGAESGISTPLSSVSCVSSTACLAVGGSSTEQWNGTAWTLLPALQTPYEGANPTVSAVTCLTSTSCTAVGWYSSNYISDVEEHWNGAAWALQPGGSITGSGVTMSAVSCSAASACVAVGEYNDVNGLPGALVVRWDGTSWALQSTPESSFASTYVSGIACPLSSECFAVGTYGPTLVERWNGTSWFLAPSPSPTGPPRVGTLTGVACTAPTSCIAVGSSGGVVTLVEKWNGVGWTVQPSPNVPGVPDSLSSVFCSSATACVAVGGYYDGWDVGGTLAEGWNGRVWTIEPTPPQLPNEYISELSAVRCTASNACTAVGSSNDAYSDYSNSTLAERWNGTSWTIQATPNPGYYPSDILNSVSCTTATACTAVGSVTVTYPFTQMSLAESWDGSTWSVVSTPNPVGPTAASLTAVSCTTPTACTAVGSSAATDSSGTVVPLAEQWNGTIWIIQPTQVPAGSTNAVLSAVKCTSTTACIAVGSGNGTLAEQWNGTTWNIQPTPVGGGGLSGIACTSATACMAVGLGGLAERYS